MERNKKGKPERRLRETAVRRRVRPVFQSSRIRGRVLRRGPRQGEGVRQMAPRAQTAGTIDKPVRANRCWIERSIGLMSRGWFFMVRAGVHDKGDPFEPGWSEPSIDFQVAFGDAGLAYRFSGNTIPAKEWTPTLSDLRKKVEAATGFKYNFVLVNRYRNGNDYIGEHRDDEKEIDKQTPIASLSLGASRFFRFRHADKKANRRNVPVVKIRLENGTLLLMNHPTNVYWYHSLPKMASCGSVRINLTFRSLIASWHHSEFLQTLVNAKFPDHCHGNY